MDTTTHSMETLFRQLGLESTQEAINDFIGKHHLGKTEHLNRAPFWNAAQADFIREAWEADSDWADMVDHLDTLLRD